MDTDQNREARWEETGLQPSRPDLFVGRADERNLLQRWLAEPNPPSTLCSVFGIGGIGKTALLTQWYRDARRHGLVALWVDGRAGVNTPKGFLDQLEAAARLGGLPSENGVAPLEAVQRELERRPVVLLIDNFEALSAIEEWVINAFWGSMPDAKLWMAMAARTRQLAWRHAPSAATKRRVSLELHPLGLEESRVLVNHAVPWAPESLRQQLATASGGHPLALSLGIELLRGRGEAVGPELGVDWRTRPELNYQLSAQWLKELGDESLHTAVDVLALLDSADQDTLAAGLGRPLTSSQYRTLANLSFVHVVDDGLALHDVVRSYLVRDLSQRQPRHLQLLRHRLSQHLLTTLGEGTQRQRGVSARRLLTLSLDALPLPTQYADLAAQYGAYARDSYTSSDLPVLREMIADWAISYAIPSQRGVYQRFLTEYAERMPQDIRVIRDPQGRLLGASLFTLVHRKSAELLAKYFPAEIRECLTAEEMRREPEQTSTYYAVLVCANRRLPDLPATDVIGILIREGLGLLGSGTRVVLVATNPQLKQLLAVLGFTMRPTVGRECDVGDLRAEVCTLDLTGGRFGPWISHLLRKARDREIANAEFILASSGVALEVGELRRALQALQHPARFRKAPLCEQLPWTSEELRLVLVRALEGRDPSVYRFVSQEQLTLLRRSYLERRSGTEVASSLNFSRASYYRYLQQALTGFRDWLAAAASHPSSP